MLRPPPSPPCELVVELPLGGDDNVAVVRPDDVTAAVLRSDDVTVAVVKSDGVTVGVGVDPDIKESFLIQRLRYQYPPHL